MAEEETVAPAAESTGGGGVHGLWGRLKNQFRHPNKTAVIGVVVAVLTLVVGIMMYKRMAAGTSSTSTSGVPSQDASTTGGGVGNPDTGPTGLMDAITNALNNMGGGTGSDAAHGYPYSGGDSGGAPYAYAPAGGTFAAPAAAEPPIWDIPTDGAGGAYTLPPGAIPTFGAAKASSSPVEGVAAALAGLTHFVAAPNPATSVAQQLAAQPAEAAHNLANTERNILGQLVAQPAEAMRNLIGTFNPSAGSGYVASTAAGIGSYAGAAAQPISGAIGTLGSGLSAAVHGTPAAPAATPTAPAAAAVPTSVFRNVAAIIKRAPSAPAPAPAPATTAAPVNRRGGAQSA